LWDSIGVERLAQLLLLLWGQLFDLGFELCD
jgi:hypothetical protein